MSDRPQTQAPRIFDVPLAIGVALTVSYYAVILQPAFSGTLLARYTTKHLVEYAVVAFFLWGITDIAFHVLRFPRELAALKHSWFPLRKKREPVERAAAYLAWLGEQPAWLQRSRLGKRYAQVLTELDARGSTDDLDAYLRHLADMDYEQTQANYALLRFQCWVMPMFGFLGTVIHFGTALSGHTSGTIGDHLAVVMDEMGTAFNTTTVALVSATTMMFAVFLCERIERGIVQTIDDRIDRELAHRFERTDATLTPFLEVVRRANELSLNTLHAATDHQAQWWSTVLERLEERFTAHDAEREQRFRQILKGVQQMHQQQLQQLEPVTEELAGCKQELVGLVAEIGEVVRGWRELLTLEGNLAENLRLLRETQQIDQALHGLTGAIHLLTARGHGGHEARAA